MTKIVIIEDEKPAARRLERMLNKQGLEVEAKLHSVTEAVEWFKNHEHPPLIFLDIQLSDGISFEIFEYVNVKSAIIFTTAYDEYALKAFKMNSVDYLLKPIDEDELKAAVDKYHSRTRNVEANIDVEALRSLLNMPSSNSYKSRFTAQVGQHLRLVDIHEIACFYSENKATYLHTFSGKNYPMELSLENLEVQLEPEIFFRINRKCIVNIRAIKDIISYTNSRLEIKLADFDNFQLIVSRERVKDFKHWLDS